MQDRRKIALEGGCCYVLSFALNLCVSGCASKDVAIAVQTLEYGKKDSRFIYRAPVTCSGGYFTASASGILISRINRRSTELMLELLSPEIVKVGGGSIFITEA